MWKHKSKEFLVHLFHGSHFAYFGAAALGAHGVYAIAAAVICGVLILSYVLHLDIGV